MPGLTSSSKEVSTPDDPSDVSTSTRSASSVGRVSFVPSAAGGHRDRDRGVQVAAVPVERGVVRDVDLDVEVAGRSAARADLALLGQLDAGAGVDARRDLDGQGAARADAAVTGALPARVGDDRAEAAAGRTRPQRADLTEERPLHVGHLAGAATRLARDRVRARGRTFAVAGRADDGGVDLELARDTERRLGQVDLEPDQRVLPAPHPGPRSAGGAARPRLAAEERVHDVGEREPGALAEAAHPAEDVAALVVRRLLLRVGEDLVGQADLLEPLLGLRVGVHVGVQLPRQPAVGLLDRLGVRVARHAEHRVGVLAHQQSFGQSVMGAHASSRMRET